jgi:thiaminase/transcriptional activator TenA
VSAAKQLLVHSSMLWPRVLGHPFVHAVADGNLDGDAFERWIVAEHTFNVEFRRFIAGLVTISPTSWDAEVIAAGLGPNKCDIDLVQRAAVRHGFDLDLEPGPSTIGFCGYLQSLLQRGYDVALAGLLAAQKVYFDAWGSIRDQTSWSSSYWPFVDTWSSAVFSDWIGGLCQLVDAAAPDGPSSPMCLSFDRVVRFELQFWTAIYVGETW